MKSCEAGWKKFQGATIDAVCFDEEPPEEIYREALIRILAREGFMLFTMTPIPDESVEGMTWIYDEFVKKQAPAEVEVYQVSVYDNPHLPETSIRKMEGAYTGEEKAARLHGKIGTLSNLIFHELRPWHITPPEMIFPHWTKYRFIDYGIGAPTACLWLAISPPCNPLTCKIEHRHGHWKTDMFHYYREYYERDRTITENAKAILDLSRGENFRATIIDPHAVNRECGSGLSIQQQYMQGGIGCILGSTDWEATVLRGKQMLSDNQVLIGDNLNHFIFEMQHYRRVYSKPRADYKERARKKDDHLVDCFRYSMGERLRFISYEGDPKQAVFKRLVNAA